MECINKACSCGNSAAEMMCCRKSSGRKILPMAFLCWRFKAECGFTLVEVMVATLILMVGLLALLATIGMAYQQNMATQLRHEAIVVADQRMNEEKAKAFVNISAGASTAPNVSSTFIPRSMRNGFVNYSVVKTGTFVSNNSKSIEIDVVWRSKGKRSSHYVTSLVSNPLQ